MKSIEIEGYRCFRKIILDLPANGLAVVIGANATGKSTLLDALDLLASVASEETGLQEAVGARGGLAAMTSWGTTTPIRFLVRFAASGVFAADGGEVEYELVLGTHQGFPTAIFEEVRVFKNGSGTRSLVVMQSSPARRSALSVQSKRSETITQGIDDDFGSLGRGTLLSVIRQAERFPTVVRVREALAATRVHAHFATESRWLLPSLASPFEGVRAASIQVRADRLSAQAKNLQTVLLTLKSDDTPRWERLVRDFCIAFPWVKELDFKLADGPMALAARLEGDGQLRLAADAFSDGMFAWLSVLTALATTPPGAILAIDEPETALHPELLGLFIGSAEDRAETRGPVLLTTHSDPLLDFLERPAESLRVLERGRDQPTLATLSAENLEPWRERFRMSELRRQGLFGGKRM